jgi:hypothetical protein
MTFILIHSNLFSILLIAIGTVALYGQQVQDSRIGLGFVTINVKTVQSRIQEVLNIPFCPITIHSGRSDDINSLDKVLFESNKSFSKFGKGKLSMCLYVC